LRFYLGRNGTQIADGRYPAPFVLATLLGVPDDFADVHAEESRWCVRHVAELVEGRLGLPGVLLCMEIQKECWTMSPSTFRAQ
jgi:hypothetical protein